MKKINEAYEGLYHLANWLALHCKMHRRGEFFVESEDMIPRPGSCPRVKESIDMTCGCGSKSLQLDNTLQI